AQPEHSPAADVEGRIVWAQSAVAWRSGRTVVGEVIVAIDIRPRKQIERVPAVVAQNGRKLKARPKAGALPWTLQYSRDREFVPLVEVGKRTLRGQIYLIECRIVAVEVGGLIYGSAVGVAGEEAQMIGEASLYLQNATMVDSIGHRGIFIVLKNG